jgi:hypothetical protein
MAESDILPRPIPNFDSVTVQPVGGAATTDVWPWLAAGVLALLGLEWLAFGRRG